MPTKRGRQLRGGVDLGGTKIEAVVVDDADTVLGSSRHQTPSSGGPQDVVNEIVGAVQGACAAANTEPGTLNGVGIGSPGIVDPGTGAVSSALNLPGWSEAFGLA